MHDLKVDQDLNISFPREIDPETPQKKDMQFTKGVETQQQLLYLFLTTNSGNLWWNPTFGFDYDNLFRFMKLDNFDYIKTYFFNVCKDLELDISTIEVKAKNNVLNVQFYFYDNSTLKVDFKL